MTEHKGFWIGSELYTGPKTETPAEDPRIADLTGQTETLTAERDDLKAKLEASEKEEKRHRTDSEKLKKQVEALQAKLDKATEKKPAAEAKAEKTAETEVGK